MLKDNSTFLFGMVEWRVMNETCQQLSEIKKESFCWLNDWPSVFFCLWVWIRKKRMNGKEVKKYSPIQLFLAGFLDGCRVKHPVMWIKRQVTIRTAVAWCMFWSGFAFLVSMIITDILRMSSGSAKMNLFVFYPLSVIMQFLCSPQHKLIANTVQRKILLFEAKSLSYLFLFSSERPFVFIVLFVCVCSTQMLQEIKVAARLLLQEVIR